MTTEIKVRISIEGGRLLSAANRRRIRVLSLTADRCVRFPGKNEPYFESYVMLDEPKGFIFREVNHGCGISGHHSTVRACVLAAARHDLRIEVCDEPIDDAVFERTAAVVARLESPRRSSYPSAA